MSEMNVPGQYYSNRRDDGRCTMTGLRIGVSADDQIQNGARWARVKRSAKLGLLSAGVVACIMPFAAQSADDLKPPASFRNWYHVNTMIVDKDSPLFKDIGGMHNVYINSRGETALKKGGPYPDKSMFLTDLHEFAVSDGSYVEGPRKGIAIMLKDKKKYSSTGGWAFQAWAGGDPKKPLVTDPVKQCFECHQPKKDQDYVYSTYIP
jgi:Cytochrome P460